MGFPREWLSDRSVLILVQSPPFMGRAVLSVIELEVVRLVLLGKIDADKTIHVVTTYFAAGMMRVILCLVVVPVSMYGQPDGVLQPIDAQRRVQIESGRQRILLLRRCGASAHV